MASINKKNGKWQVRVSYYDEFGKRHFKNKNGFSRKVEAEAWANSLELDKFNNSIGLVDTTTTFYAYYSHWLETYKFGKLAQIIVTLCVKLENYLATLNSTQ